MARYCCLSGRSAAHCRRLWQLLENEKLIPLTARFDTRYLDADLNTELASQLGVRGLPTLLVLRQGQPVSRAPAQQSVESVGEWLQGVSE